MTRTELLNLLVSGTRQLSMDDIRICGIYFLMLKGEVVYVGQSVNVYGRIESHLPSSRKTPTKQFDGVRVLPCDESMLNELEHRFIAMFRPAQNSVREIAIACRRCQLLTPCNVSMESILSGAETLALN